MSSNERALRKKMVQIAKLTYSKGMIAASDGNMSAKISEDRLLVTPSGLFKGFLVKKYVPVDFFTQNVDMATKHGLFKNDV